MSLSFLADVLNILLLSYALQCVAAASGKDNGSSSNSPNQPVIELVGNYRAIINPDPNYCQPPDRLRIFRPSSALQPNERKLRLCPLPKSDERATGLFQQDKLLEHCLFEINDDRTNCEDKVNPYLIKPKNASVPACKSEESNTMYIMGSAICFPFIKAKDDSRTYNKGINGFLDYANQEVATTVKIYDSYRVCYNKAMNRTKWAQRLVTPGTNLQYGYDTEIEISTDGFDLEGNRFEKMRLAFAEQDTTSPDEMVPQMLVPKEDNSYSLWEINTSHYINVEPLWISLVPLMNLINKRIALLAHRMGKALPVVTQPFYNESIENATKKYLDKDEEILIPNIWTINVYEANSKSGIIIILHNTPNKPPKSNELCIEAASCEFRKWGSTSTTQSFGKVADEYLKYAYCCKTTKYESLIIENVIDMNFEK